MTIKEAAKTLEDKYMTYPDVFGVNVVSCKNCKGDYIEVYVNTHNAKLMASIPSNFSGFRVEKVHQTKPVEALSEVQIVPPQYYGFPYPAIGFPIYGGGFRRIGGGGRPHGGRRR